jgi:hypothetical protein
MASGSDTTLTDAVSSSFEDFGDGLLAFAHGGGR